MPQSPVRIYVSNDYQFVVSEGDEHAQQLLIAEGGEIDDDSLERKHPGLAARVHEFVEKARAERPEGEQLPAEGGGEATQLPAEQGGGEPTQLPAEGGEQATQIPAEGQPETKDDPQPPEDKEAPAPRPRRGS